MKIIFAGGGTAGHVNPGLAAAAYIREKEPQSRIYFAGGRGGIEEKLVSREGYEIFWRVRRRVHLYQMRHSG